MLIHYKIKTGRRDPGLDAFEQTLGFRTGYRNVRVPASIGEGRLVSMDISDGFHANFQFYRLNVPLQVIKEATDELNESVFIVFYQLEVPETAYIQGTELPYDQGVNIYTQPINALLEFPAHTQRDVVCMRIDRRRLADLLAGEEEVFTGELLRRGESFFVHEQVTPAMRSILGELRTPPEAKNLQRLFYQVRAQQLVYLLMEQLNKRTGAPVKSNNPEEIAKVFKARHLLTGDLAAPPTIASLARGVLMSESQLKQAFREVFGVSIYQYFQQARMERARELLAEGGRTVTEVGYELGFTNIGHFSRLFERAYNVKPKRFQLERLA
ncbi:AraC family transcriptional regulator [Puia sp.]|uniref:AraC family transcriptional regulator n=1 Tax=Puia sp. TaxID=2045100 RepID=UPI002F3F1193